MCTAGAAQASGDAFAASTDRGFDSAPQALAMADAAMDYLNAAVAGLDGSACGDLLIALGAVQAKLTAAHAALLRRFDAAGAHDADRHGSSSAWPAARAGMSTKDARTAVRQMRQLGIASLPLLANPAGAARISARRGPDQYHGVIKSLQNWQACQRDQRAADG
jgi:hypothetical protein